MIRFARPDHRETLHLVGVWLKRIGTAGIYQRHDWADEKRFALEAWARHVEAICAPVRNTNVVQIGATKQSA